MTGFSKTLDPASVCIDARDHIGPHQLAIGKTRKLFERDGIIHAFYSRGYEIAHTRLCADTLRLLDTQVLDLPAAWGGGAFCIDDDGAGSVTLVFLHRNQHEFCAVKGTIENGEIAWEAWRSLLVSRARQAAPWVEVGRDGTAWASVLDRDGDFRIVAISPDGMATIGNLFKPGEPSWYHSCVQMLPVRDDMALAVSFRGTFPLRTELVFRTVSPDLTLGETRVLAPCTVNDKLTFHFQAVGDPARGRAHIVYLDEGLSTSHALFDGKDWKVSRAIVPGACFAPQICINDSGAAVLIVPDYEGVMWRATWSMEKGWSAAQRVDDVPVPNVSAQFAQTCYGTGGMISAARSSNGRVPFLSGVIEDDRRAHARLHMAMLGRRGALSLADEKPLDARVAGGTLNADINLCSLQPDDLKRKGRRWLVSVPADAGRALRIELASGANGLAARAFWLERDGSLREESAKVSVTSTMRDAFSPPGETASLHVSLSLKDTAVLQTGQAWVDIYESGTRLADTGPYDLEAAAKMALHPERIPAYFKRMV